MQVTLTEEKTKSQINQMEPQLFWEETAPFPACFLGLAKKDVTLLI